MQLEHQLMIEQERRIAQTLDRDALEQRYIELVATMFQQQDAVKGLAKTLLIGDLPKLPP